LPEFSGSANQKRGQIRPTSKLAIYEQKCKLSKRTNRQISLALYLQMALGIKSDPMVLVGMGLRPWATALKQKQETQCGQLHLGASTCIPCHLLLPEGERERERVGKSGIRRRKIRGSLRRGCGMEVFCSKMCLSIPPSSAASTFPVESPLKGTLAGIAAAAAAAASQPAWLFLFFLKSLAADRIRRRPENAAHSLADCSKVSFLLSAEGRRTVRLSRAACYLSLSLFLGSI
jgi:hypothetical protein